MRSIGSPNQQYASIAQHTVKSCLRNHKALIPNGVRAFFFVRVMKTDERARWGTSPKRRLWRKKRGEVGAAVKIHRRSKP